MVLVIVIVTAIVCIKRGFVKSFFKSAGFIAAAICALLLMSVVSPYLREAFVEDLSYDFVRNTVCNTADGRGFDDVLGDIVNENPELCGALEHLGVDANELLEYASGISDRREELALDMLVRKIAEPLCNLVSDVLAFLLSFAVIFLLLKLIQILLDTVVKLPVLRSLNKTLGVVYGLVLGCIRSGIFIMIVSVIYPMVGAKYPTLPLFQDLVAETVIFKFIANNNILSLIINTFI